MKTHDVVVVGSGPNGLAAAITMAQAGYSVMVFEAAESSGGGTRSEALTRPGFIHDVCSAVHPLAGVSPFFRAWDLKKFGLEWIHSPLALAHPFEDAEPVEVNLSLEATAENLGEDGESYLRLMRPLVNSWEELFSEILRPVLHWPQRPWLLTRYGLPGLLPAEKFTQWMYRGPRARAFFAGMAAHSNTPLNCSGTTAIGLMLNIAAHARGWPIPRGGSQKIAEGLVACLRSLGGEIQTHTKIHSMEDLPKSRWVFFDLTPRQILSILNKEITAKEQRHLAKFRYGSGVFKMDWALAKPIPWSAKSCAQAATIHLGSSFNEIVKSEALSAQGLLAEKPYVLLNQPSLFDSSRAPQGEHTAWAYCHVPHGSEANMIQVIERQIERFAPGFQEVILARNAFSTSDLQRKNPNLIGGDILGGAVNLRQLMFRPSFKWNPYRLSIPGFYICSSSTPPGPGVHGMCGYNAALSALHDDFKHLRK